jgi:hypothetical protein
MKKTFIICLLLLVPSYSFADKVDINEFDGNTWQGWTVIEKVFFAEGFISGTSYIISNGSEDVIFSTFWGSQEYSTDKANKVWQIFYDVEKKKKATFNRRDVSLMLDSRITDKNASLSKFGIYQISVGQITDGLDLFYSDFKNKQIKLGSAIYVVKKQIEGSSSEEIEALVQWLRGGGTDFTKRYYIDKEGKKEYISFP